MRHYQGALPRVELLFNVGDSALNGDDGLALEADRAVVLRYPDAEAQWPLDASTTLSASFTPRARTSRVCTRSMAMAR